MKKETRICGSCSLKYDYYGQKASLCRLCKRVYDRTYYANRSDETKKRKTALQAERKRGLANFINNIKSTRGCIDCKIKNFIVLDFDHIKDKSFNISDGVRSGYGEDTLMREIGKCDIVCANCHRIRTYNRRFKSSRSDHNRI